MGRPPNVGHTENACHRSVDVGWCKRMVFLVIGCRCFTSTVSAFPIGRTIRPPVQRQHVSCQVYFLPNNSICSVPQKDIILRPKAVAQKGKRTVLYAATINSLQQQQEKSYTRSSDSFSSSTTTSTTTSRSVNALLSNNRTIAETTWQLLNGTEVGSWDHTDFEMMEHIVESLCSASSLSHTHPQPQQQQQEQVRRLQQRQQHYKRAASIIERFLHRIIQEQRMENPFADCVDMTALYTNLIYAWSNSYEMGSPERAEEILDYFQSIYEEGDSYDPLLCGPTIDSFNAVIGAYAQSGRTDAPQQSIRVLTKLFEWNKAGRTMASPNQQSFART